MVQSSSCERFLLAPRERSLRSCEEGGCSLMIFVNLALSLISFRGMTKGNSTVARGLEKRRTNRRPPLYDQPWISARLLNKAKISSAA